MKIDIIAVSELRKKSVKDLDAYVLGLNKTYTELVHAIHINKEKSTHQLGRIKKSIARAHTVRTEIAQKEES